MIPVVIDLESYFNDDYTFSKLSTESYVRDPRFELHGAAVKWTPERPAEWYAEPQLRQVLKQVDWSNVFLVSHHAQWDHFALSHHYDVHPRMSGCTLSMARLLLGNHIGVSLDSVRKQFNLPPKITPYNLFKGKHWHELSEPVRHQVAAGAVDEVESIWTLFGLLLKDFPVPQLEVIDSVVKMFTEPVLRGDVDVLAKVWTDERDRKQALLARLNLTAADLQSNDRFAALLREAGAEPEMKDGKNGKIYAFSKQDAFMQELQDDDNEEVRLLAAARLGVKSTLMQTRAETLGWMARRGPLPVYLRYAGAGTLRPSGGDGANWLNFKRGSALRKAILAPKGYLLGPVDSSQIECRVLHYLAGGPEEPVIQKFRAGEDPYIDLSSLFYGEPIYKPKAGDPRYDEMVAKRGMGKQGRLMCLGPDTAVLTNNGVKTIIAVHGDDLLWDGLEWVVHRGLVFQGEQNVVNIAGVLITQDHPVLCGTTNWSPAACLQQESTLFRALGAASANLPCRATSLALRAAFASWWCAARAVLPSIQSIHKICLRSVPQDAEGARKNKPAFGSSVTGAMPISAPTKNTDGASWDALAQFIRAAIQKDRSTTLMPITAGEAFEYTDLGARIAKDFLPTYLPFEVGISPRWKLTGLRIKKAIVQAIYGLQIAPRRLKTGGVFETSNKKLLTYDISYAGPRNRFTILSSRGPLIVHNCGYGAAGEQFRKTAKTGAYGPSVDIPLDDAKKFVAMYRHTNPAVCAPQTGYWAQAGRMLARLAGGEPATWGPLTVRDHRIFLPDGSPLIYDTLEYFVPSPEERDNYREHERKGHWRVRTRNGWKTMWGSKLVQNICEAVACTIVSQAMTRCKQMGYRTLNWPYDELLLLIPDDGRAEWHLQRCVEEMRRPVNWLPGLPLDAEAHLGERYEK